MREVDHYLRRHAVLTADHASWGNVWETLARFVMPNRRGFVAPLSKGDTAKDDQVTDGTAIEANQKLASSMHGALTAPSARWFSMQFRDKELNEDDEAREWLEDCQDRMYDALGESNFDTAVNEAYLDYTGLGTGNIFCEPKEKNPDGSFGGLSFSVHHLSCIAVAENRHGQIDTVFRALKMSARNAVSKWPDAEMPEVRKVLEQEPDKEFKFLHIIEPNDAHDPDKILDPKRRKVSSIYISCEDKEVIEESGYHSMPHMVFRFLKQTGESFGVGPGHFCLPEILGLNRAKELELDAWEKSIDPPMKCESGIVVGDVNLVAGGITMLENVNGMAPMYEATNWNTAVFKGDEARAQIRRCFFDHLLDLPGGPNVTATEIVRRIELMQREMAPMLGRIQAELLNPLIERVFSVMYWSNAFDQPPQSVASGAGEGEVDVEYVSPMARAQKSGDIDAINRWVATLVQLAGSQDPRLTDALDWVDTDKIPQLLADRMGTPAEAVRSEDEVKRMRAEREKAQAEAQQAMLQQQAMAQQGATQ